MTGELDITRADILTRITATETTVNPLAHKIGLYSLAALGHGCADAYRRRLGARGKVWESQRAVFILKSPRTDERHGFSLVTSRKRRQLPVPGCIVELIFDEDYTDPLAHIKTPDNDSPGIVVVNGIANNPQDLEQIWPFVEKLNGSRILCEFEVPHFPHLSVASENEQIS